MSRAMHCRPSHLFGYEGVRAYYFDAAVVRWGTEFQAAIEEAGAKAKTSQAAERAQGAVLRRWLGPAPGMYRDPAKG